MQARARPRPWRLRAQKKAVRGGMEPSRRVSSSEGEESSLQNRGTSFALRSHGVLGKGRAREERGDLEQREEGLNYRTFEK